MEKQDIHICLLQQHPDQSVKFHRHPFSAKYCQFKVGSPTFRANSEDEGDDDNER